MVRKEVISIHIGQCGLQIGTAIWELFLLEHNINIDGKLNFSVPDSESSETFFYESTDERFVPRAMLIDSESNVIDEIKTGVFRNLFHPKYIVSGLDDGANNFARGSFCLGNKLLVGALHKIRMMVENCELLQGFILNHSISGGTGSGLSSVLLHALSMDYSKIFRFQVPLLPGTSLSTSIVDPYNTTLHLHSSMDTSNVALLIENQSLYNICKTLLQINSPFYSNINRIIAVLMSSITCSMRFGGPFKTDFVDIGTNLIPYPRIHFPVVAHTPIVHESRKAYKIQSLNKSLTQVFSPENLTINCKLQKGTYMSILLNARGNIPSTEISHLSNNMKLKNYFKFVEWSPKGFKISINPNIPVTVPESGMGALDNSLTMLCNNTALKELWIEIGRKFDILFNRRAYLHWYVDEGMEETEFMEARLDLAMLWEDYEEISMTTSQIERELQSNPAKQFRYSSDGSVKSSVASDAEEEEFI